MSTPDDINEKKLKAISYLLELRRNEKRTYQLSVQECADALGFKNEKSARTYMNKLVEQGDWETAIVIDPDTNHKIRVYWLKYREEKED